MFDASIASEAWCGAAAGTAWLCGRERRAFASHSRPFAGARAHTRQWCRWMDRGNEVGFWCFWVCKLNICIEHLPANHGGSEQLKAPNQKWPLSLAVREVEKAHGSLGGVQHWKLSLLCVVMHPRSGAGTQCVPWRHKCQSCASCLSWSFFDLLWALLYQDASALQELLRSWRQRNWVSFIWVPANSCARSAGLALCCPPMGACNCNLCRKGVEKARPWQRRLRTSWLVDGFCLVATVGIHDVSSKPLPDFSIVVTD